MKNYIIGALIVFFRYSNFNIMIKGGWNEEMDGDLTVIVLVYFLRAG